MSLQSSIRSDSQGLAVSIGCIHPLRGCPTAREQMPAPQVPSRRSRFFPQPSELLNAVPPKPLPTAPSASDPTSYETDLSATAVSCPFRPIYEPSQNSAGIQPGSGVKWRTGFSWSSRHEILTPLLCADWQVKEVELDRCKAARTAGPYSGANGAGLPCGLSRSAPASVAHFIFDLSFIRFPAIINSPRPR